MVDAGGAINTAFRFSKLEGYLKPHWVRHIVAT